MMRRSTHLRALALAVAAGAIAVLPLAQVHAAPAAAPAFTIELLDGTNKTLRLAEYKGSPIILLFWAPW